MLLSLPPPVMLSLAIVLEVVATSLLPKTQQFTSLPATVAVLIGYGCAFYLLSLTVQTMSLGVEQGLYWSQHCLGWFTGKSSISSRSLESL